MIRKRRNRCWPASISEGKANVQKVEFATKYRSLIGVASFALVVFAMSGCSEPSQPKETAQEEENDNRFLDRSHQSSQERVGSEKQKVPEVIGEYSTTLLSRLSPPGARETYDSSRISFDPDYALRVKKHIGLRSYANSPARNTAETIQIKNVLKNWGLEEYVIPDAYIAAWEINRHRTDGNLTRAARGRWEKYFAFEHGITNKGFIDSVSKIDPKIPWGPVDRKIAEGEVLY